MINNNPQLFTEYITTADGFAALRDEWDKLLENTLEVNPFLSHQWLYTWWEVYGHGELHIIICRDSKARKLVGVFPLFRFQVRGLLPVKVFRFIGSERVSSDFLDCLACKGLENEVFSICLDALHRDKHLWDMIELQDLADDSLFYRFLEKAAIPGVKVTRDLDKLCPYRDLPNTWDTLLAKLSKKMRQRVGYYRRALERNGTVELEKVVDSVALPDALDDLIRIRRDRLERKGLSVVSVSEVYRRFHSQIMSRMLQCGRLRLYFLKLNGERIAYLYLFAGTERLFFYQTGFDRYWSSQSVGFTLLGMVIEDAIGEGFSVFEFLRGDERYKYEWNVSGERQLVDISISGRTLTARLYYAQRYFSSMMFRATKFLVPKKLQIYLKGVFSTWKSKNQLA